jgi:L-ribulokinase
MDPVESRKALDLPVDGKLILFFGYINAEKGVETLIDAFTVLKKAVPDALKKAKAKPEEIVGIGIDFTSCTILPVKSDGTPLCVLPPFRRNPHAWVKLWKHHGAQRQADKINRIAEERDEPFLARYGRKISCEWMFPKILEILDESPEVYQSAARIIEGGDWVVWQMTGNETRSACNAGYKALWSKKHGFPQKSFFKELRPDMEGVIEEKIGTTFFPPGHYAGGLKEGWAKQMGLEPGTPVGAGIIDAHSALLGLGVREPNQMVLCMGTSTCHLLLSREEKLVRGISGVVEDGIIRGYYGYEAGQAAVGDLFAWFVKNLAPKRLCSGGSLYEPLEKEASKLEPAETGLLALDWWNGNRSVLADAELSGLIVGLTLNTKPHETYRALIEATAMGTLRIIEEFESQGVAVKKLHATGGIAERSPLTLQIYSDVTGREVEAAEFPHCCGLGAAILGAASAGSEGGRSTLAEVVSRMAPRKRKIYRPDPGNHRIYRKLYGEYSRLHDYFGRGQNEVMKKLREWKKFS